ncbi:ATP-binding protein [Sphingomonas glacialis]|uniref:histidine kinase n=1 Tax=Sphingomonas glacialis TaxID=658225 RepID=A0A502G4F8_9SPHN|nr:ATP-binding protein [Sphingomonas glacialis]TPG56451.1 PAS domain S-box protein [Sphingomonas glacialis]
MTFATEHEIVRPTPPNLVQFLLLTLLAPVLLAVFSVWLEAEYASTDAFRQQAHDGFENSARVATLIERLTAAESAQRGFVITGERRFLDTYSTAKVAVGTTFLQLPPELRGHREEEQRLATLRRLARLKFAEMDEVIAKRRTAGLDAAASLVSSNAGQRLMEQIRLESTAMVDAAGRTRDREVATYRTRVGEDATTIRIGIGIIGLAMVAVALLIWRQGMAKYRSRLQTYDVAERNRAILQSTVDAIVIFDPNGMIETVNAAAAKMLGYRAADLIRWDSSSLIKQLDTSRTFHQRIGLVDGQLRMPHRPDRKLVHHDGHEIPVDVALGVMRLPAGDYIVASARNIAERKRAERMKDELISTVSHELRTPLTSVVGALSLLRSGAAGTIAEAPARLIEIAENNSRRLIRLINDMLDIDRIQSGQLTLQRERTNLCEIAAQACEGSQGAASALDVQIECLLPKHPVLISGDAERLLQVISNLASNALRVTSAGGTVRIGVAQTDDGQALVTVDDDGPGVPIAFRDRIFGRFERATHERGVGTGLGLAISREIITRHDGRIWFEDRPAGGTRFAFALDRLREDRLEAAPVAMPKILVCTADADVVALVESLGIPTMFEMVRVDTVAAASAALARGDHAALLLDPTAPEDTDCGLVRALQASLDALTPPIVLVTAEHRARLETLATLDGVEWIEEPIDPARIAEALRAAVARSGTPRPTILHLDDDQDVLLVTEAALRLEANVLKATDLAAARKLIDTHVIDLAILDFDLGGASGLDLLPTLASAQDGAIPAILFSARDVGADVTDRVDAVLVKSRSSIRDLKAAIRRILAAADTTP